jgi:CheY-like chemotaxis protein
METSESDCKTVLIADDDGWVRDVLTVLLADEGLRPVEASSGPETVELARQQHPDVILLDVALPGRSGLQVLQDLREGDATRNIPVMLVSGEVDLLATGLYHNAAATFHKPLDFGAFLAKVHEVASR